MLLIRSILALISGAILTFAFAPFELSALAQFSLAILFSLIYRSNSLKQKTLLGFIFGLGFFGTSVSWVYVSVALFSQSIMVAVIATSAFVLILSCFTALFGFLAGLCVKSLRQMLWIYPCLWVLIEILRSYIFTGFPWVLVGYSQVNYSLGSLASIGSVYLVSYFTALIASTVTVCLRKEIKFTEVVYAITLIAIFQIGAMLINNIQWTTPNGKEKTITLVQANFVQDEKWDISTLDKMLPYYYQTLKSYPSDLMFWSENSIPTFKYQSQGFFDEINRVALKQNTAVLVGTVDLKANQRYTNHIFVLGKGSGSYDKHHLVPFGEYFPMASLIQPIMSNFELSNFSAGARIQPLMDMNGVSVAGIICFESAYATQVRAQLQDAQLLAVITDDAWFGKSLAPWQHIEIAKMRAIETGRYVVQASNDGITGIIRPNGKILQTIPPYQQAVLVGALLPMQGHTPWVMLGLWPFLLFWVLQVIIVSAVNICKLKRSKLHLQNDNKEG